MRAIFSRQWSSHSFRCKVVPRCRGARSGGAARRKAELPARVVVFAEPVGVVEGRIGEDEVGAEIGMEIAPEGVGLLFAEIGFDAADGEVHHGEAARGGVALLTVDADVAELAAVGFDEFFRLHEHAAGTAAGIVNAAFVGSEHLDEETHDTLRSVELAAFLALNRSLIRHPLCKRECSLRSLRLQFGTKECQQCSC